MISDPDITVKRAYLKPYRPDNIRSKEKRQWDNQEVYDQMVQALNARGAEIVSEIPTQAFRSGIYDRFLIRKLISEHQALMEND
mgnify:CR=1 FL=1